MKSSVGVIGAGIQGVCISLFLIKRGFKVTLIDRDDPGRESASYGNAGHFSPYASVPINRPDILTDVPAMLLSSTGPLALKWNYVPRMNSRNNFSRLYCYGFGASFFVYVAVNMSMVLGLLPIVGAPLPIMSYGGSSMLAMMIGLGIVMSCKVNNQSSVT